MLPLSILTFAVCVISSVSARPTRRHNKRDTAPPAPKASAGEEAATPAKQAEPAPNSPTSPLAGVIAIYDAAAPASATPICFLDFSGPGDCINDVTQATVFQHASGSHALLMEDSSDYLGLQRVNMTRSLSYFQFTKSATAIPATANYVNSAIGTHVWTRNAKTNAMTLNWADSHGTPISITPEMNENQMLLATYNGTGFLDPTTYPAVDLVWVPQLN